MTVKVFPVSRGTVQLTGSGERMSICSGDFTRVGSGGDLINAGSTSGSSLFGCWSESCSSSPGAAPSVARIMSTFQTHMCCTCISMMLCTNVHAYIHICIHTYIHTYIHTHRYTHTHTHKDTYKGSLFKFSVVKISTI